MGVLSLLILIPLVGAALLFLLPSSPAKVAKLVAFSVAVITFLASLTLLGRFQSDSFHFQVLEKVSWIPSLGISYSLGIDGISLWLILLTTLIGMVAIGMSRRVEKNAHAFMALLLLLESFMIGAFSSLDLILFFAFFELTLFPFYFLITVWGGERRGYAGAKFFLYTFAGSIFMLIGMITIAFRMPGSPSFDLVHIQAQAAAGTLWGGNTVIETLVFWAFAVALLIKAPAFPFHTWMPDAYGESPTVIPVVSSVLVKLGSFGLLRFCLPLFPDVIGSQVPIVMGLAVAGILYGAILAAVQPNMRRLIAYSSLSHMGFILLGIFSLTHEGMVGATFQQLNHAVITGGIVALLAFLYERHQSSLMSEFGGLKSRMPIFAALFLILMLASVGLPGTNGFIGEFLALMGTFEASAHNLFGLNWVYPSLAGLGVVLAAIYLLNMFQRIFYGLPSAVSMKLADLKGWESAVVLVPIVFVIWGGFYPSTFLKPMEASLQATRLMATAPEGQRPSWEDGAQTIDLRNGSPTEGALISGARTLTDGSLHFTFARSHSVHHLSGATGAR
jgi:NADH-quinone oxidoreductase subunit M